jgi:hypothetical protein
MGGSVSTLSIINEWSDDDLLTSHKTFTQLRWGDEVQRCMSLYAAA